MLAALYTRNPGRHQHRAPLCARAARCAASACADGCHGATARWLDGCDGSMAHAGSTPRAVTMTITKGGHAMARHGSSGAVQR